MSDKDKAERLAAALRDNLRRRKAQARDRGVIPAKAGISGREDEQGGGER
ncbi:MAG TPA: hypothetical protein VM265_07375 [Sphingomicrobium sp.]|nr:hypothetical protein [Sphingomicrobium sp.]